jgi:hypothetical protein
MTVELNLESDPQSAFFALYAGLRMYQEQRDSAQREDDAFSIAAAEAYCMLEDLREQFPEEYEEAKQEYDKVYGKIDFSLAIVDRPVTNQ